MLVCFLSLSFVFFCFLLFSSFRPLSSLFNLLGISGPQVFHIPLSCLSHHHRHSISSRSPNLLNPSGFPVPSSPLVPLHCLSQLHLLPPPLNLLLCLSAPRVSLKSTRAFQSPQVPSDFLPLNISSRSPILLNPSGFSPPQASRISDLLKPLVPFVPNPLSPPSKEAYLCKCTPLAKFTT